MDDDVVVDDDDDDEEEEDEEEDDDDDAFNAVFRQLEQHSRRRHGHVKKHCDVLHGRIARLMQAQGYGFIEGTDGNEYYFSITNAPYRWI